MKDFQNEDDCVKDLPLIARVRLLEIAQAKLEVKMNIIAFVASATFIVGLGTLVTILSGAR